MRFPRYILIFLSLFVSDVTTSFEKKKTPTYLGKEMNQNRVGGAISLILSPMMVLDDLDDDSLEYAVKISNNIFDSAVNPPAAAESIQLMLTLLSKGQERIDTMMSDAKGAITVIDHLRERIKRNSKMAQTIFAKSEKLLRNQEFLRDTYEEKVDTVVEIWKQLDLKEEHYYELMSLLRETLDTSQYLKDITERDVWNKQKEEKATKKPEHKGIAPNVMEDLNKLLHEEKMKYMTEAEKEQFGEYNGQKYVSSMNENQETERGSEYATTAKDLEEIEKMKKEFDYSVPGTKLTHDSDLSSHMTEDMSEEMARFTIYNTLVPFRGAFDGKSQDVVNRVHELIELILEGYGDPKPATTSARLLLSMLYGDIDTVNEMHSLAIGAMKMVDWLRDRMATSSKEVNQIVSKCEELLMSKEFLRLKYDGKIDIIIDFWKNAKLKNPTYIELTRLGDEMAKEWRSYEEPQKEANWIKPKSERAPDSPDKALRNVIADILGPFMILDQMDDDMVNTLGMGIVKILDSGSNSRAAEITIELILRQTGQDISDESVAGMMAYVKAAIKIMSWLPDRLKKASREVNMIYAKIDWLLRDKAFIRESFDEKMKIVMEEYTLFDISDKTFNELEKIGEEIAARYRVMPESKTMRAHTEL